MKSVRIACLSVISLITTVSLKAQQPAPLTPRPNLAVVATATGSNRFGPPLTSLNDGQVNTQNRGGGGGGNGPIVGSFGSSGGAVLGVSTGPTVLGISTTTNTIIPTSSVSAVEQSMFKFTFNLSFGMRNDDVMQLQTRLTAEGVYGGPITGYFGPLTRAVVMKYQGMHGLEQVGRVGPKTRATLNGEPLPTGTVSSSQSNSWTSEPTYAKPKPTQPASQDYNQSQTGAAGATDSTDQTSTGASSGGGFWGFVSKLLRGK